MYAAEIVDTGKKQKTKPKQNKTKHINLNRIRTTHRSEYNNNNTPSFGKYLSQRVVGSKVGVGRTRSNALAFLPDEGDAGAGARWIERKYRGKRRAPDGELGVCLRHLAADGLKGGGRSAQAVYVQLADVIRHWARNAKRAGHTQR